MSLPGGAFRFTARWAIKLLVFLIICGFAYQPEKARYLLAPSVRDATVAWLTSPSSANMPPSLVPVFRFFWDNPFVREFVTVVGGAGTFPNAEHQPHPGDESNGNSRHRRQSSGLLRRVLSGLLPFSVQDSLGWFDEEEELEQQQSTREFDDPDKAGDLNTTELARGLSKYGLSLSPESLVNAATLGVGWKVNVSVDVYRSIAMGRHSPSGATTTARSRSVAAGVTSTQKLLRHTAGSLLAQGHRLSFQLGREEVIPALEDIVKMFRIVPTANDEAAAHKQPQQGGGGGDWAGKHRHHRGHFRLLDARIRASVSSHRCFGYRGFPAWDVWPNERLVIDVAVLSVAAPEAGALPAAASPDSLPAAATPGPS